MSAMQTESLPQPAAMVVSKLRNAFASQRSRPIAWRLSQLQAVRRMLIECETLFCDALKADLGRSPLESIVSLSPALGEVEFALRNVRAWASPQKVRTPMVLQPGKAWIQPEPRGVVLLIGPWNYPIQLMLAPLIGALAAGNAVVLKPSELTRNASQALADAIARYLDPDFVQVVQGGAAETQELLKHPFDHIFYTGGASVGRIVMTAAAKHLTPVTLELGGKSPCIVDHDADLDLTARRIAWGKFFNAGQTCLAPDYVLVHKTVEAQFLDKLKQTIRTFYGPDPRLSDDYARIVNSKHHQRLSHLLVADAKPGSIVVGGERDEAALYIAPTVLTQVPRDARVMDDEIFGPILPVLPINHVQEAIEYINARPKPLAAYAFGQNKSLHEAIVQQTSSGGVCINDVMSHYANCDLPFGGVGPSGMGAYHGKASFDTFTHFKSVLRKSTHLDPSFRYPPYNSNKLTWLKRFLWGR